MYNQLIKLIIMKRLESPDNMQDLLNKINKIKSCIKDNTNAFTTASLFDKTISFMSKDNIQINIKLYK